MSELAVAPGSQESPGNVLVVDDSVVIRAIVGHCLRGAGFTVAEAENGAVALRMLEREDYDVVVTDLQMPEMGGMGVLAAVRQRAIPTEVVILTGSHAQDMEAAVRALRLGAHDFLTKPPSGPEVVVLTVQRAVEKKRLRDANARLVSELKALSSRDGLTGLLNRRTFEETLEREHERVRRYGHPLSLLMIDLDHFKSVNDTYGHRGGDMVLRSFAAVGTSVLRETDLLYRYGGEEFVALLPDTPAPGALDAACRVVSAVAGTPASVGSLAIRVTCSVGAACLDFESEPGYDIVAHADKALYEAKRSGRNRAVLASPRRRVRGSAASTAVLALQPSC